MTPDQMYAVAQKLRTPEHQTHAMGLTDGFAAMIMNRLAKAIEEVANETNDR